LEKKKKKKKRRKKEKKKKKKKSPNHVRGITLSHDECEQAAAHQHQPAQEPKSPGHFSSKFEKKKKEKEGEEEEEVQGEKVDSIIHP